MKVAILAGGRGTRLAEETDVRPKPMVEVGGRPLLWHLMRYYETSGFDDFVIALGYKGDYIKRWMVDYAGISRSDLTIDFRHNEVVRHQSEPVNWTAALVDTGLDTNTGGRIKRLAPHLGGETFMLTYGDGLSNVDLRGLLAFHRAHGRLATVTAVRPLARFGRLNLDGPRVTSFSEKPTDGDGLRINGGFFVLEPEVLDYISGDSMAWEQEPLTRLAEAGELMAFQHDGFWQCMDTIRDREYLEELWAGGAPWQRRD